MKVKLYRILSIIKIVIMSIFYRKKIYLVGIPIHGNIGDQAILLAEEKFIKDNFKKYKIIKIESSVVMKYGKMLKRLGGVNKPLLCVHGGGFLGSLWSNEEEMFRTVLLMFPENTIIVLPQTIYFSQDDEGKKILKESKEIYNNHKHLYICCREKYSYDFMKKEFPECNILLIPDMVLYLNNIGNEQERNNVLFCIRSDKEKVQHNLEEVKKYILQKQYKIDYTDTVIKRNIYLNSDKNKTVINKIKQFGKYKLVVTDRLHGMIFALLSNTPCLVFENKSYKIKGVYKWIENNDYIELCDINKIEEQIESLLKKNNIQYNNTELLKEYKPLIKLIKQNMV